MESTFEDIAKDEWIELQDWEKEAYIIKKEQDVGSFGFEFLKPKVKTEAKEAYQFHACQSAHGRKEEYPILLKTNMVSNSNESSLSIISNVHSSHANTIVEQIGKIQKTEITHQCKVQAFGETGTIQSKEENLYDCCESEESFDCLQKHKRYLELHQRKYNQYMGSIRNMNHLSNILHHQEEPKGERTYNQHECVNNVMDCIPQPVETGGQQYDCTKDLQISGVLPFKQRQQHVHTGEKPYKYTEIVSGKSLGKQSNNGHQEINTEKRLYICTDCGKSFTQFATLNRHHQIHTGGKQYACTECGMGISRSSQSCVPQQDLTGVTQWSSERYCAHTGLVTKNVVEGSYSKLDSQTFSSRGRGGRDGGDTSEDEEHLNSKRTQSDSENSISEEQVEVELEEESGGDGEGGSPVLKRPGLAPKRKGKQKEKSSQAKKSSKSSPAVNTSLVLPVRSRKTTSLVWQFFYIDPANSCRAICSLCNLSVSRGRANQMGTSGLKNHLKGKHPLEWGQATGSTGTTVTDEVGYTEAIESAMDLSFSQSSTNSQQSFINSRPMQGTSSTPSEKNVKAKILIPVSSKPNVLQNQLTVQGAVSRTAKFSHNHPRTQMVHMATAKLLAKCLLPYRLISTEGFQEFMEVLEPRYQVPSGRFFSQKAVPELYEFVSNQVRNALKTSACNQIHITTDTWTSGQSIDYMIITAHWACFQSPPGQSGTTSSTTTTAPPYRMEATLCVTALEKGHIGAKNSECLKKPFNQWLTPCYLSPGFIVSATGSNIVKSIKDGDYEHIPCFTHCINLLLQEFLQDHLAVKTMLSLARKICSHISHSSKAQKIFQELQRSNGLPLLRLKQEVSAQWTSTYYMLERLLQQRGAVNEYVLSQKIGKGDAALTATQWSLIENLVVLLEPFEAATQETRAGSACLSQVLPQTRYLHMFLEDMKQVFREKADSFAVALAESLDLKLATHPKLSAMFEQEHYILATLLDPRFKNNIEGILSPGAPGIEHWKEILVNKLSLGTTSAEKPQQNSCESYPYQQRKASFTVGVTDRKDAASPTVSSSSVTCTRLRTTSSIPAMQKGKTLLARMQSKSLVSCLDTSGAKSSGAGAPSPSLTPLMIQEYLNDPTVIGLEEDPLCFWKKKRRLWPSLANLAVFYLTCPPSSISSERLFSSAGNIVSDQRASLSEANVEHLTFLKLNLENKQLLQFAPSGTPKLICSSEEDTRSDVE
ncbi:zinc finger BED domain-containing protein 6-like [Latimeria chalumnae]|uniref:zinc finger BED domain-containing protein 6-like n=1 Tax=Latimeria chalumnae TaxID=7897 RepID=UPI0006D93913|nr:PREDICTED: zinc finger BED domain-containing protein 6-like [Latimeria chalumnae]XP_014343183.1 PREDICTED: zinc finger BED domain-containing protein 6-like [Latimeria chalumnae]|eukprot:XP_014343182.1 PREDICTED: zinc finger BED domain-containing protein 6-like [Latimeria chalumnae]